MVFKNRFIINPKLVTNYHNQTNLPQGAITIGVIGQFYIGNSKFTNNTGQSGGALTWFQYQVDYNNTHSLIENCIFDSNKYNSP